MGKNKNSYSNYTNDSIVYSGGNNQVIDFPSWDVETPINERSHVAWEDKATGSYYRSNYGVKSDGESYRRYANVKVCDKEAGYSAKYYAEEKYEKPQSVKGSSSKSNKYYA